MSARALPRLQDLLQQAFSRDDFTTEVLIPLGLQSILQSVEQRVSDSIFFSRVIANLDRRRLIDSAFFDMLIKRRERWTTEIVEVAGLFGVAFPQPEQSTASDEIAADTPDQVNIGMRHELGAAMINPSQRYALLHEWPAVQQRAETFIKNLTE